MADLAAALAHCHECIAVAERTRALFDGSSPTVERIAAHAFFCRSIDHCRGAVALAQLGLDPEALTLVRGIVEATFVIGALLKGTVSTSQLEAFDRAGRAKAAKSQADFLARNASAEIQDAVRSFAESNAGRTVQFEELAKLSEFEDLYNGQYRIFSHHGAHASMSSVSKYLVEGDQGTTVVYPGSGRNPPFAILFAASLLLLTCSTIEQWLGTTPEINRSIWERLRVQAEFGAPLTW